MNEDILYVMFRVLSEYRYNHFVSAVLVIANNKRPLVHN